MSDALTSTSGPLNNERMSGGGLETGIPRVGCDLNRRRFHPLIERHRKAILKIAEKDGFSNVRVFGSMARGDVRRMSDIDLLVHAPKGTSLLDMGGMLVEVEELTDRRVDLVSDDGIYPPMRRFILKDARQL